jgi:hypothetical protein
MFPYCLHLSTCKDFSFFQEVKNFCRQLPRDLWKEVFLSLDNCEDFFVASKVCKTWHSTIFNKKFLQQLVKITIGIDLGDSQEFHRYIHVFKMARKFNKFDEIPWNCVLCNASPRDYMQDKKIRPSASSTLLEKLSYYSARNPYFRNKIPFWDDMLIFWCGCQYDTGGKELEETQLTRGRCILHIWICV